jgi:hypothetical protein
MLLASILLVACASLSRDERPERLHGNSPAAVIAYHQAIARFSSADLGKEKALLAAQPATPDIQVRQAILLGHPRNPGGDLGKAVNVLDGVLKASEPVAVALHPLSRLLADSYLERQRLEAQHERQAQQLRDSQRKATELQEKLDSLADIERTLPTRPRAGGRR